MNKKQLMKEAKDLLKKQNLERLIKEMPITPELFFGLLQLLIYNKCKPDNHDYTLSRAFFKDQENVEEIYSWLQEHGGECDCSILMDVSYDYDPVINRIGDFNPYLLQNRPKETGASSLPPPVWLKAQPPIQTPFFNLTNLVKPWQLFSATDIATPHKLLWALGKKGLNAELRLSYCEEYCNLDPNDRELMLEYWHMFSNIPASLTNTTRPVYLHELQISQEHYLIDTSSFSIIEVYSDHWLVVCVWIFSLNNPNFYFFYTTSNMRKRSDLIEIKKLLATFEWL